MHAKKVFWVSISLILSMGVCMSQEIVMNQDVTNVLLRLDGTTKILLKKSPDDALKISDLVFKGTDKNPVQMILDGNTALITQKSNANSFSVSYTLAIPDNKNIKITAGNLLLDGEVSATGLEVNSGNLSVSGKFEIEKNAIFTAGNASFALVLGKCEGLSFRFGNVSGKIHVPRDCKYTKPPFWSALKIHEGY